METIIVGLGIMEKKMETTIMGYRDNGIQKWKLL